MELGLGVNDWQRNNDQTLRVLLFALDPIQTQILTNESAESTTIPLVVSVRTHFKYDSEVQGVMSHKDRSREKPRTPVALDRFGFTKVQLHLPSFEVLQTGLPFRDPRGKCIEEAYIRRTNIEGSNVNPDIRPYIAAAGYTPIMSPERVMLILEDLWRKIDPVKFYSFRRRG